jgi:non-ribosomal peptide synthetase-like protein
MSMLSFICWWDSRSVCVAIVFDCLRSTMILARMAMEFVKIILPLLFHIYFDMLYLMDLGYLYNNSIARCIILFWGVYVVYLAVIVASVITLKWLLLWAWQPGQLPLWSFGVWRGELIVGLVESLADPLVGNWLRGTPFVVAWFRAMGSHIGNYVYMDTLQVTEWDLITVGDEAALNEEAVLQTHLFEDRVMKMSTINIGKGATLRSGCICLYDTIVDEGASLHNFSLLMKGETLPKWTSWHGLPSKRFLDADLLHTLYNADEMHCLAPCCGCI